MRRAPGLCLAALLAACALPAAIETAPEALRLGTLRWRTEGSVDAIVFRGAEIVVASQEGGIVAFDAASGERLRHVPPAGELWIAGASPDGRVVLADGDDRPAALIDLARDAAPVTLSGCVERAALSPDGALVATTCREGPARLHDARTGRALGELENANGFGDVAFAGPWIAAARGPQVVLFDAKTRRRAHALHAEQPAFAVDGAGRRLVVRGRGGLELWSLETGRRERTLPLPRDYPHDLAFSPDGHWLAGEAGDRLLLWDLEGGGAPRELPGLRTYVRAIAFSPDGRLLAAGGNDGRVHRWTLPDGAAQDLGVGHGGRVERLAFTPDGARLVTAGALDGTVAVWDARSGALLRHLPWLEGGDPVFAPTPDGVVVGTAAGGRLEWWGFDGARRRSVAVPPDAYGTPLLRALHVPPDGGPPLLIAGRGLHALDAEAGRFRWSLELEELNVYGTIAPSGRRALLRDGAEASLAEPTAIRWTRRAAGCTGLTASAFSPDEAAVAVATGEGDVRLYAVADGAPGPAVRLAGADVRALAFTPEGVWAATDAGLRLWEPATGRVRGADTPGAWSVATSPDGARLAAGFEDGTVLVWPRERLALAGVSAAPAPPPAEDAECPDGGVLATFAGGLGGLLGGEPPPIRQFYEGMFQPPE